MILPNSYLVKEYNDFLSDNNQILVTQIREPDQIAKFLKFISIPYITILVTRNSIDYCEKYGNDSDDNVCNFNYDYYFNNSLSLNISSAKFISLVKLAYDSI